MNRPAKANFGGRRRIDIIDVRTVCKAITTGEGETPDDIVRLLTKQGVLKSDAERLASWTIKAYNADPDGLSEFARKPIDIYRELFGELLQETYMRFVRKDAPVKAGGYGWENEEEYVRRGFDRKKARDWNAYDRGLNIELWDTDEENDAAQLKAEKRMRKKYPEYFEESKKDGRKRTREMMLEAPDYSAEDFLKAVDFLSPKGMTIDRIVVPQNVPQQVPEQHFEQLESNLDNVPGVTDTIVYQRRDPAELMDAGDWDDQYVRDTFMRTLPGARGPMNAYSPANIAMDPADGSRMGSPFVAGGTATLAARTTPKEDLRARLSISESRAPRTVVKTLNENFGPLLRNVALVYRRV
jgi:hypothetical protein